MASSACTERTRFSGVTISTFSLAIARPPPPRLRRRSELQLVRLPRDHLELQKLRVGDPRRLPGHVQHALQPLEVLVQLPDEPPALVLEEVLQLLRGEHPP